MDIAMYKLCCTRESNTQTHRHYIPHPPFRTDNRETAPLNPNPITPTSSANSAHEQPQASAPASPHDQVDPTPP